jgi:hypothetical protein
MIVQGLLLARMSMKRSKKSKMNETIKLLQISPLITLLLLAFFTACSQGQGDTLEQELLFTLEIGRMEDDIDLVEQYGEASTHKTTLVMRDGLFFISNGNAGKVMEFNSYGDIISLYYNPQENPAPVVLKENGEAGELSNRRAFPWPYNRIGEMGLSGNGILLVEEKAQDYQIAFDEELGVSLHSIILRFTEDGEILDFLGQEGVGGTPFPYIEEIQTVREGKAAVISRAVDRWLFFLFDHQGVQLAQETFRPEEIPLPAGASGFELPSIKKIFTDYEGGVVYVIADFYRTDREGGVNFDHTAVATFDLEEKRWLERIPLPEKLIGKESGGIIEQDGYATIYEAIGVSRDDHLFFIAPEEGDLFELMIMSRDGTVRSRKKISLRDDEISYRDLYLSREGILCALLAYEFEVDIVWWRSDRLLEETL